MDESICGAKARSRSGQPCRLLPMSNGRCRFHGGKMPIKHGRYSKNAYKTRIAFNAMIREAKETLNRFHSLE